MNFSRAKGAASLVVAGAFVAAMFPGVSSASGAITAGSLNTGYSTMLLPAIQSLAAHAKGGIGVILPDETTSTRYVEFDAPAMTTAFSDAGLKPSQFNIQNAQGSDSIAIADAEADLTHKDKVLIVDVEDSATAATIQKKANLAGAKVIEYDRLYSKGAAYVSFNNVTVGSLIGKGLVTCLTTFKVKSPLLYVMDGAATDPNAAEFAAGYDAVLTAKGFAPKEGGSGNAKTIAESAGTWTPSVALTDFQGAYSKSNNKINAVVTPNDENAAPIISYLQSLGLGPKTVPFTGQDATLQGFQNIISGYQCGTVYKPSWEEAQAAAVAALYLDAGKSIPASLLTGKTAITGTSTMVPTVELTPTWVTTANIEKTVIKDTVINKYALCTGIRPTVKGHHLPTYAADCKTFGIK
jgi:D-xylose transport system substrate-binding protein